MSVFDQTFTRNFGGYGELENEDVLLIHLDVSKVEILCGRRCYYMDIETDIYVAYEFVANCFINSQITISKMMIIETRTILTKRIERHSRNLSHFC